MDPRGIGVYGYPDAGYTEVGAIGGVPVGAIGYPEPSGRPEQGSLGESWRSAVLRAGHRGRLQSSAEGGQDHQVLR